MPSLIFGLLLLCIAVASVLHSLVHPTQLRQKDVSPFYYGLLRAGSLTSIWV